MANSAQDTYDKAVKAVEATRDKLNAARDKTRDLNSTLSAVIGYLPEGQKGRKTAIPYLIAAKEAELEAEAEAWKEYVKAMGDEMLAAKALMK